MILTKKTTLLLLSVSVLATACKKKKPGSEEETPADAYDQKAMFENYSGNLIVPAFQSLLIKTDSLVQKVQDFNASPSLVSLESVRTSFKSVYRQYVYVSAYEFGPSATLAFRTSSNVFPTDTTQINGNISSGSYDLNQSTQTDAIGLPALDYVLYGYNKTDLYILNLYLTTANRRQYLYDVCAHFRQQVESIRNGWSTYAGTFNNATGNSVGSSLSNLVNQFSFDYEITKNARLGIPLGKQTLGVALPVKCEAYYSHYSLALLAESIKALENIYLGRSQAGSDGNGLDDYLEFIGRGTLNSSIKTKFSELKSLVAAIPGPLSATVSTSPGSAETAYAKIQELLVLLKADMPSALSVTITYVDGDGD